MKGHPSRIRRTALTAALAGALAAATATTPAAAHAAATTTALAAAATGQPAGTSAVQEAPATTVTATRPRSHRVVAGDTLWAIAARYCGTGRTYPRLARASGITNPDRIYAGRTVVRLDCAGQRPTAMRASRATSRAGGRAQEVVTYARAQVGDAYLWGAAGPSSWDCSGLVMRAYAQVGIRLPHQSGAMLAYGRRVGRSQLRPGDLVWPHAGHVQLYIGAGRVIEAATYGTGVIERRMWGFWTARRLL